VSVPPAHVGLPACFEKGSKSSQPARRMLRHVYSSVTGAAQIVQLRSWIGMLSPAVDVLQTRLACSCEAAP
jgi:hypothetical protein